jgi:polysaccharide biosynthesis protein PslG
MPRSSRKAARSAAPSRARTAALGVLLAVCAMLLAAAEPAHARPALRGMQLHSLWWGTTDAEMDRELDLAAGAHSTVVRVDVAWGSLEPDAKGELSASYTARIDRFVAGAQARGMKVIATLWGSPCWASTAPDSLKQDCAAGWWGRGVASYPPANPADYADAAGWMTERYGTELAALEIWNEPNGWAGNSPFWHAADPAGAYAALVRTAYPAAKAGNPAVPVLAGALAGSDASFLQALYADGIMGFYDGVSSHPYADPGFGHLSALHAAQLAAGDGTPVWATEFGYATGAGPQWHVSEADQAFHILRDFADIDTLHWVATAIIYDLRDDGTDPANMEDNFGLVHRDFSPKPGYGAAGLGLSGSYPPPASTGGASLRSAISEAAGTVIASSARRRKPRRQRAFDVPSTGRLAAGRLRLLARVAESGSTIRAEAFADLRPAGRARIGRRQLIGRTVMRGVKSGRARVVVRFTVGARRALRSMRRATVTLRLWLVSRQGRMARATCKVALTR